MNHLMVEYLVKSLSEEFEAPERRKNRLLAHELRTSRRAARRRRSSQ
ncbi:hypothetical protein [Nocardioides sp.]